MEAQSFDNWSGPTVLTLVLSVIALAVSVGALAWQYYSWKIDGPVLKIEATLGWLILGDSRIEVITISARNEGRLSTIISAFDFDIGKGTIVLAPTEISIGRPPVDMPPGSETSFNVDINGLANTCVERQLQPHKLVPRVRTGHGNFTGKLNDSAVSRLENLMYKNEISPT